MHAGSCVPVQAAVAAATCAATGTAWYAQLHVQHSSLSKSLLHGSARNGGL